MNTLYETWIRHFLPVPLPEEPLSVCDACPMLRADIPEVEHSPPVRFDPRLKCCTHFPVLPNFILGGLLEAGPGSVLAHGRLLELMARGIGLYPAGIFTAESHQEQHRRLREQPESFGRVLALRCPLYVEEGGLCGIWPLRYAVCSTWFCKHTQGVLGRHFWNRLRDLLLCVERTVSMHCMKVLDVPSDSLAFTPSHLGFLTEATDLRQAPFSAHRWWGPWQNRIPAYFVACWEVARNLGWEDILSLGGEELHRGLRDVQAAHTALQAPSLPDGLWIAPFRIRDLNEAESLVWSYSSFHPLRMPKPLAHLLSHLASLEMRDGCQGAHRELRDRTLSLLPMETRLELLYQGILIGREAQPSRNPG